MGSGLDMCTCKHERSHHIGNARKTLDRKGCSVTYCHCPRFELDHYVAG